MKVKIIFFILTLAIFSNISRVSAVSFTPQQLVNRVKQGSFYEYINSAEGFSWEISYNEDMECIESKYSGINAKKEAFDIEIVMNYDEETNSLHYKVEHSDKEILVTESSIVSFIIFELSEMYGYDTKKVQMN